MHTQHAVHSVSTRPQGDAGTGHDCRVLPSRASTPGNETETGLSPCVRAVIAYRALQQDDSLPTSLVEKCGLGVMCKAIRQPGYTSCPCSLCAVLYSSTHYQHHQSRRKQPNVTHPRLDMDRVKNNNRSRQSVTVKDSRRNAERPSRMHVRHRSPLRCDARYKGSLPKPRHRHPAV
jgi:hypothetical protein